MHFNQTKYLQLQFLNYINFAMGNNDSKDSQSKQPGTHQYERFGAVTIKEVDDPHGDQKISYMSFSRPVESEKVLSSWLQQISRIDDSESRQILLLPQKHAFEKSGFCGSSGLVNLTYENFPFVLDSEIKNRKKLNRYFMDTEMWYLLYNMIRAGNKFQKLGKKIGDINPHNVVINDDGQIKAVSTCSMPNQLNNFQKVVQNINSKVYLAPQQANPEVIGRTEYPSNLDPAKAEVFSIGLTILSSGILQNCQKIYKNGYQGIDERVFNQLLNAFRQQYGNGYLFTTLASMLSPNPNTRRKASQVYNELYPNQNNILNLQPFPQRVVNVPSQVRPSFNGQGQPMSVVPNQRVTYHQPIQQNLIYTTQRPSY